MSTFGHPLSQNRPSSSCTSLFLKQMMPSFPEASEAHVRDDRCADSCRRERHSLRGVPCDHSPSTAHSGVCESSNAKPCEGC